MVMTKDIIRQGDVLIVSCGEIPETAVPVAPEDGRLIVARGEATGHHHSFRHRPGIVLFRDGTTGPFYLRANSRAVLEHQEHTALATRKKTSVVVMQRVFSSGAARLVAD